MRRRRGFGQRGFTLIELILATVIFGFIALTVYGVLSRAIQTRLIGEERAALYSMGREVLLKIASDVEGALLPLSGDRIFFEGNSDPPRLSFIAMNRGGYAGNRVRPGQVLVEYWLADGEGGGYRPLLRGETDYKRYLAEEVDNVEYGPTESRFDLDDSNDIEYPMSNNVVLLDCPPGAELSEIPGACARLVGMSFRFYDDASGEWRQAWDSFEENSFIENRIPDAVEVALLLHDERGFEHEFHTVVDLPLARANPTPGQDEEDEDEEDDL